MTFDDVLCRGGLVGMALFCSCACHGVTIYVNQNNVSGVTNGFTLATGWITVADGLAHLAVTNAVVQGGHTVLVAPGSYNEFVNPATAHKGVPGSRNELRAMGKVVIDAELAIQNCVYLNDADYFVMDGFDLANSWGRGLFAVNSVDIVLCNLFAYNNQQVGIYVYNACNPSVVSNCTSVCNTEAGFGLMYSDARYYNCVSVGNGYGFRTYHSKIPLLVNNLFYDNHVTASISGFGDMYTAAELNSVTGPQGDCTANIVAHPEWVSMANMDLSKVYSSSPLINAGTNGATHIGREQSLTIVGYTSETFYVNSGTGNDGNSGLGPAEAWATLDKAGSVAGAGDTVYVAAGAYSGGAYITNGTAAGAPLKFVGQGDVLVNASGCGNGITMSGCMNGEMTGFQVRSASTSCVHLLNSPGAVLNDIITADSSLRGISVYNSTGATVANCLSTNNTVTQGGIVFSDSYGCQLFNLRLCDNMYGLIVYRCCNLNMVDSVLHDNSNHGMFTGGGSSDFRMDRCSFYDNGGIGLYINAGNDSVDMRNCRMFENTSHGIHMRTNVKTCWIRCCTVVSNGADGIRGDLFTGSTEYLFVRNCILAANAGYGLNETRNDEKFFVNNNCLYDNITGNYYDGHSAAVKNSAVEINSLAWASNNIVADPVFKGVSEHDYRIEAQSQCVNAGTETTDIDLDFYRSQRLVGPAVDIGIYELPPAGSVLCFW